MEREKLADVVMQSLGLERKPDLTDWEAMVENLRHPDKTVNIAMVGKYTQLHDAYLGCGGGSETWRNHARRK